MYRLIISEKARDPYGRALEILGSYNPFTKELECKQDRIEHWLNVGAGMSPTVNNLLIEKEIIKGEKVTASQSKAKKKAKEEGEKKEAPATTKEEKKDKGKGEEKPAEVKEEKPAEQEKEEKKPEEKDEEAKPEEKKEESKEEKKE
jgi:ribosomal protein S16